MKTFVARRAALVAAALGIAIAATACLPPAPAAPPQWNPPINDINGRQDGARRAAGLPGFIADGGMNANAQRHAQRMASTSGGTCRVWHSGDLAAMYPGKSVAENVACVGGCIADGSAPVNLWLGSPPHAANIMNPAYRFIGSGAHCDGARTFVVSHYRSA